MKLPGLKRARERAEMTQAKLAERVGVARETVARYECGLSQPDVAMLRQLSSILNVTVDELLDATLEQAELPGTAPAELAPARRRRRRQAPAPESPAAALSRHGRTSQGVA